MRPSVDIQDACGWFRTGWRFKAVFVVLEKQAPRVGACGDDVQHSASGFVHEPLVFERAGEKLQRWPCLVDPAFREPSLIQRVAANQMLAQGSDGPLAEMHGSLRVDPVTDGNDSVEVTVPDLAAGLSLAF